MNFYVTEKKKNPNFSISKPALFFTSENPMCKKHVSNIQDCILINNQS